MTWIRAGLARIHRTTDDVARPEVQAPEALVGIRPDWLPLDTRQRWRVSTQNRRLAWVFVIAFARHHIAERLGFLLESPSILRLTLVNGDATRPSLTRGFAAD